MALLDVKHLTVDFNTDQGVVHAVRDISFSVGESEAVGIVGESGSGKSVTMYSVMGLLASNGGIKEGSVVFDGKELTEKSYPSHKAYEAEMSKIRGNEMSMIFQDPMTFLNPVARIGKQITEVIKNHNKVSDAQAREQAVTLMGQVGIPSPRERFGQYPHEFSGGMRQRIIIAMALANNPKPPQDPDRRRAHHGSGCDDPGPGAGTDQGYEGEDELFGHHDHPRPGCGGKPL